MATQRRGFGALAILLALAACTTTRSTLDPGAGVQSFAPIVRPIAIEERWMGGVDASGPLSLVAMAELATARTDPSVPSAVGGLSSLQLRTVSKDGVATFLTVSDQGSFVQFSAALPGATPGPAGQALLRSGLIAPIRDARGQPLAGDREVDAEGLARLPRGWMVSLERHHRLLKVDEATVMLGGASSPGPHLTGFDGIEPNGGMEALTRLPDGRMLASAEYGPGKAGELGARLSVPYWVFALDQKGPVRPTGRFANTTLFGITEARVFGTDLWLLKREYDPVVQVTMALVETCPLAGVLAGAPVCTRQLRLAPPFPTDNFEGLAFVRDPRDGATWMAMLSDDNFSKDQRTLLLWFKVGFS
jgi:hypothetical protein